MKARSYTTAPLFPAIAGCFWGIFWQVHSCIKNPAILILLLCALLPLIAHAYLSKDLRIKQILAFFICMLSTATLYQLPIFALNALHTTYKNTPLTLHGKTQDVRAEGNTTVISLSNVSLTSNQETFSVPWFSRAQIHLVPAQNIPLKSNFSINNISVKPLSLDLQNYQFKEHLIGFFFPKKNTASYDQKTQQLPSWFDIQKERLESIVASNFSQTTSMLAKSIFLGQAQSLNNKTRILFEQWGISHYLARSGLHLVVLAALIIWLLGFCPLPLFVTRFIALAITILYHTLTAPSVSFLRAFMMNLALGGSFLLGTTPNALHVFSVVTLITILANPFVVFHADFQLSFGISGALIFVFNQMQRLHP